MFDASGVRIKTSVYRLFGEAQDWTHMTAPAVETKGWIGERYDAGAGLQYLNARYYVPQLGMFIQPDWFEVTKPGVGTNRYSNSFNDPMNLRDPGGNKIESSDVKDEDLWEKDEDLEVTFDAHCATHSCRTIARVTHGPSGALVAVHVGSAFANSESINARKDAMASQRGIRQRDIPIALSEFMLGTLSPIEAINMAMGGCPNSTFDELMGMGKKIEKTVDTIHPRRSFQGTPKIQLQRLHFDFQRCHGRTWYRPWPRDSQSSAIAGGTSEKWTTKHNERANKDRC